MTADIQMEFQMSHLFLMLWMKDSRFFASTVKGSLILGGL